jgi:hypothetical protein
MPSINSNPWIAKKKKKKPVDGPAPTIVKPHAARFKYNDIVFNSMPTFEHVDFRLRHRAQEQHTMWINELKNQPVSVLHYSLTGKLTKMPRQTVCYLIEDYCLKTHVSHETLNMSITQAGGDISVAGLVSSRRSDNAAVYNLHTLGDDALWRVYCSIPDQHRPAERPKPLPRAPRPPKVKRGGNMRARAAAAAAAAGPVTVEEDIVWACCDKCDRWRRVPDVATEEDLPSPWFCTMHPGCITCDTPEEQMDADEKWSGDTNGVKAEHTEMAETAEPSASESSESEDESEELSSSQPEPVVAPQGSFTMNGEAPEDDGGDDVDNLFGDESDNSDF